jgi:hypothetical protein
LKKFKNTLNECYETNIPEQFDVGMRMMTDHPRMQKEKDLTDEFIDP